MLSGRRCGRIVRCALLLIVVAVIAVRVCVVNLQAEHVPEIQYGKGDWVKQGEGYLIDRTIEHADGYEYRINGVKIMTPNQYLKKYSKDKTTSVRSKDADRKSVVVVDMTIRNLSNVDGGVIGYLWYVVPDAMNDYYQLDTELFSHAEPEVGESAMFSVEKGCAHRTHLAFSNIATDGFLTSIDEVSRQPVSAASFQMRISARPERKVVRFATE